MSLLYALLRGLLGLLSRSKRGEVTEIENAVLRHQLKVLRRQVRRPRFRPFDRVFLAAAAHVLPRDTWASFLVTPPDAAPVAPRTRPAEVDLPHRVWVTETPIRLPAWDDPAQVSLPVDQ